MRGYFDELVLVDRCITRISKPAQERELISLMAGIDQNDREGMALR